MSGVLPGPVDSDRLYVFGDGAPKMIYGGTTTYDLAVQSPSDCLCLRHIWNGDKCAWFNAVLCQDLVIILGEESQLTDEQTRCLLGARADRNAVRLTMPPNGRLITKERIYRAQTSFSGTQLYFIAERNVSTETSLTRFHRQPSMSQSRQSTGRRQLAP